jgi:NAD(P)H dehydrogenase (quinone)
LYKGSAAAQIFYVRRFQTLKPQRRMAIRLAIFYYSSTGTNYTLARWAADAAEKAGAEVRIRKAAELAPQSAIDANPAWKKHVADTQDIPVATLDDLSWADAYLFTMPTRYGNVPAQLKQFLDGSGPLWQKGALANKAVSAMCSAMNAHGGQEQTILALYTTMYHWGSIVVAPGYTDAVLYKAGGNPYGTSVSVDEKGNMQPDVKDAVTYQTRRLVDVATWLQKGKV